MVATVHPSKILSTNEPIPPAAAAPLAVPPAAALQPVPPVAAPPDTDVDLGALLTEMEHASRVAEVDADFTARTLAERQGRDVRFKIAVVMTLASIVLYFAGVHHHHRPPQPHPQTR